MQPRWFSYCCGTRAEKSQLVIQHYLELVGGLFSNNIGTVIIPTDELIFFRGVGLNHQAVEIWLEHSYTIGWCIRTPIFPQNLKQSHKVGSGPKISCNQARLVRCFIKIPNINRRTASNIKWITHSACFTRREIGWNWCNKSIMHYWTPKSLVFYCSPGKNRDGYQRMYTESSRTGHCQSRYAHPRAKEFFTTSAQLEVQKNGPLVATCWIGWSLFCSAKLQIFGLDWIVWIADMCCFQ